MPCVSNCFDGLANADSRYSSFALASIKRTGPGAFAAGPGDLADPEPLLSADGGLLSGSPLTNAGDPAGPEAGDSVTDLAGNPADPVRPPRHRSARISVRADRADRADSLGDPAGRRRARPSCRLGPQPEPSSLPRRSAAAPRHQDPLRAVGVRRLHAAHRACAARPAADAARQGVGLPGPAPPRSGAARQALHDDQARSHTHRHNSRRTGRASRSAGDWAASDWSQAPTGSPSRLATRPAGSQPRSSSASPSFDSPPRETRPPGDVDATTAHAAAHCEVRPTAERPRRGSNAGASFGWTGGCSSAAQVTSDGRRHRRPPSGGLRCRLRAPRSCGHRRSATMWCNAIACADVVAA